MKITYQEYLQSAHKNTPQVYFDYLYRRLSHPLSYIFVRLNITPNQIALAQTVLYALGAYVIVRDQIISGFIIFMVSYLLDFCDGNVARAVIKYKGIEEKTKKKGLLLENLNTNVSLLALYFSLGFYLWSQTGNIYFFILAFLVFGVKMIMRYTEHHASVMFMNNEARVEALGNIQKVYKNSLLNKVKFLIRKSLFSANFYFVVYLFIFLFAANSAWFVFLVYAGLDAFFSLLRLVIIFTKEYKLNE